MSVTKQDIILFNHSYFRMTFYDLSNSVIETHSRRIMVFVADSGKIVGEFVFDEYYITMGIDSYRTDYENEINKLFEYLLSLLINYKNLHSEVAILNMEYFFNHVVNKDQRIHKLKTILA